MTDRAGTLSRRSASRRRGDQLTARWLHDQDYSGARSYRPRAQWYRRLNPIRVPFTTLGLSPRDAVTLEVVGRRSGRPRQIPIPGTRHERADLLALAGESQWVRNVRAAHGQATLRLRDTREQARWCLGLDGAPTPDRLADLAPRLAALGPTVLGPGHGPSLTGPDTPRLVRAVAANLDAERATGVRIAGKVVIHAAITDVFDTVADERKEPRYNARIVRAEILTDEPVRAGSRFVAEPRGMGASWDWTMRLVCPMLALTPVLALVGSRWERRNWVDLEDHLEGAGRRP